MDIKVKSSQLSATGLTNKKLKKSRTTNLPDTNQIVDQVAVSPDTILSQDPIVHIDPIAQALSSAIESSGGGGSSVGSTESYSTGGDFGNSWSLAQNTPKEPSTSSSITSTSAAEVSNSALAMVLGGLALAGLAVGGGGGGSSSSTSSASSGTSGALADGYIANALVFRDVDNDAVWDHEVFVDNNNNGIYDTGDTFTDANGDGLFTAEAYAITDASGVFTGLTGTGKIVSTYLTDSNGSVLSKDISTGLSFTSTYAAPDGSTIVNPLTSLIAAQLSSSTATAAEIAAAQTAVLSSFGITLPTGSSLLTYDPLAVSSSSTSSWETAVAIQKVAAQVANTIQVLAAAATGVDTSMASSTATMAALTALATTVSAGTTIDLSSASSISKVGDAMTSALVTSKTWTIANAAAVTTQVTSASTSLASINTSISNISATSGSSSSVWATMASTQKVAQTTLAAAIQEAAQGGSPFDSSAFSDESLAILIETNTSTASVVLDTAPPVTPTIAGLATDSGTDTSDKITNTGTLVINNLETNATVQYSVNNGSFVRVLTLALAPGENTVKVRQTDAAGNISASSETFTFTYDTTVPSPPKVNTATVDDVINSAERIAGVTITGTTESGSTVTVNGNAATVSGTTWSYTFDAAAIDTFAILDSSGSTELTIIATDLAGNTTTAKAWPKIDTTAPVPVFSAIKDSNGDLLTAGPTTSTALLLSGSNELGSTVSVFNGNALLGLATVSGTAWSYTVTASNGESYNLKITEEDLAGNVSAPKAYLAGAGDAVIDLGVDKNGLDYGQLIAPIQVDGGKWFYHWDRNGNNVADAADVMSRFEINQIFNYDSNGVQGSGTTDTVRFATINGLHLALPTLGLSNPNTELIALTQAGTAVGSATNTVGDNTINTAYEDLLAIWDAYNGNQVSLQGVEYWKDTIGGLPPSWLDYGWGVYASATPSFVWGLDDLTRHYTLMFGAGAPSEMWDGTASEPNIAPVALQVIEPSIVIDTRGAPVMTGAATAGVQEGATGTVYTASATQAGSTLTYALGGADAVLFNINENTGALIFRSAPDFEAPGDLGGDNVYNITVTASNGVNTSAAQAVAITVTNVDATVNVAVTAGLITTPLNFGLSTNGSIDGAQSVYLIPVDGFAKAIGQDVLTWSFASGNFGGDRSITPLLFEKVGEDYVLRAIGTTQQAQGNTVYQDLAFNVLVGDASIKNANYIFGWKDGTQTQGNEGVIANLSGSPGLWISRQQGQAITAQNVDFPVDFSVRYDTSYGGRDYQFSVNTGMTKDLPVVTEGEAAQLFYTFTRSGDIDGALTVSFEKGGTATAADYVPSLSEITFAAGSSTATLVLSARADQLTDIDETLTVTVIPGQGYSVGSSASATGTIQDKPPLVSTVTESTSVAFTKEPITFTVTFSETLTGTIGTTNFTASDGTVTSVTRVDTSNVYTVVVTPAADIASGTVTLSLVGTGLTDAAGNKVADADLSGLATQAIDTLSPMVTFTAVKNSLGGALSAGHTNSASLELSGSNEAGASVSVYNGSTLLGQAVVTGTNWTYSVTTTNGITYDLQAQATDAAGNVGPLKAYFAGAGDAVIDLGEGNGQLIAPVQVDGGKWFYYWDVSVDGTAFDKDANGNSADHVLGWQLHDIFNKDLNGVQGPGTSETYRYATLNGIHLSLPTIGLKDDVVATFNIDGSVATLVGTNYEVTGISGIAYTAQVGSVIGSLNPSEGDNTINPLYDDLLAIWDAYNGNGITESWRYNQFGTGWGGQPNISGMPTGWNSEGSPSYASASHNYVLGWNAFQRFYDLNLSSGTIAGNAEGERSSPYNKFMVALEVLGRPVIVVDTTAPLVSTVTESTSAAVTKDPITFTVTFSETLTGTVGTSNFNATNGSVTSVSQVGTSNAFTVVVTPTAGVASGSVALSLVGTDLTDAAGNTVAQTSLADLASQSVDTTAPTLIVQYASSVIDVSSQYGTTAGQWSALDALGPPNTFTYGGWGTAWANALQNMTPAEQFIHVGYATPINATGLSIRETFDVGFVRKVELFDASNTLRNTINVVDDSSGAAISTLDVSFPETTYLVASVKVFIDTSGPGYELIDSIALWGASPLSTTTLAGSAGDSAGEAIALTLNFDGVVNGLTTGTDNTIFTVGGSGVSATWSGTGSTRTLTYTIASGQNGQAAIDEAALKTALSAGITDEAGNAFAYSGSIANIDASALPVVDTLVPTNAAADFMAGPNDQSTGSYWQYFSADFSGLNLSNLQLLSDWDTDGNSLIGQPQWDGNGTDGDYPFVQKQSNGTLIVHPDNTGKAVVVAWKNTTTSNVTVDLTGSLSLVGKTLMSFGASSQYASDDGITYVVTTSASVSSSPTVLQQGSLDESTDSESSIALALSGQTLAPGAVISVAIHGNNNYYWDHTQLDLQITPEPLAGQSVIDLGSLGQLIEPVQVESKWYYFWDRSGDGIANDADLTSHDVLDSLFNRDIAGVSNTTVANADSQFGTTDTYRYGAINGVRLALPTLNGEGGVSAQVAAGTGYQLPWPGTEYTDAGSVTNGTTTPYADFTAIWDAYNGIGTGTGLHGLPPGWSGDGPWTATPGGNGHLVGALHSGGVWGGAADNYSFYYVALEVL